MAYDPKIHHRRSIRLRGHDYSGGSAYFITSCTKDNACMFGQIVEDQMMISGPGRVVEDAWLGLPRRFPGVVLDAHQVMPNHFHGIIVIPGPGLEPALAKATGTPVIHPYGRVGPGLAPSERAFRASPAKAGPRAGPTKHVSLTAVVGAFKSLSAIAVNRALAGAGKRLWQEDYYEHIIRDVAELEKIRDYIVHNPARWHDDSENFDS